MPKSKLRLRDWLFGAAGKRRLIASVLTSAPRSWNEAELARAAGLHAKGSVDVHIRALVQLGVLVEENGRYRLDAPHPLVQPLRELLAVIASVEDAELNRVPEGREGPQRRTQDTR